MSVSTVILIVLVLACVYAIFVYNRLVGLKNQLKNAFVQIDVQLQRRYELIPNLVESAKAYMGHEQATLSAVIQARNQASSACKRAKNKPDSASGMRNLSGMESLLQGALGQFMAVVEDYPDLKANENFQELNENLLSTENRVSFARQAFNDTVMMYNIFRETFPNNMVAKPMGFKEAYQLELQDKEARKPVRISFK